MAGRSLGEADHGHGGGTQTLRTAAVFIVLAAGLLGGLPPLFIKVRKTDLVGKCHCTPLLIKVAFIEPSHIHGHLVAGPMLRFEERACV